MRINDGEDELQQQTDTNNDQQENVSKVHILDHVAHQNLK